MKRFSVRLFALGLALGALGAASVLAASAYARTAQTDARWPRPITAAAARPRPGAPLASTPVHSPQYLPT